MPYKLRKAPKRDLYWVVNKETGKKHSRDPLPKETAKSQMRALYASEKGYKLRGGELEGAGYGKRYINRVLGWLEEQLGYPLTETQREQFRQGALATINREAPVRYATEFSPFPTRDHERVRREVNAYADRQLREQQGFIDPDNPSPRNSPPASPLGMVQNPLHSASPLMPTPPPSQTQIPVASDTDQIQLDPVEGRDIVAFYPRGRRPATMPVLNFMFPDDFQNYRQRTEDRYRGDVASRIPPRDYYGFHIGSDRHPLQDIQLERGVAHYTGSGRFGDPSFFDEMCGGFLNPFAPFARNSISTGIPFLPSLPLSEIAKYIG